MTEQTLMQAHRRLVKALMDPACYPHPAAPVERIETHISMVLLAGDYVYKLKKPLDLGFLDFTSLAQRQRCCEEEIRLNRRLAPEIYLGVSRITGSIDAPLVDDQGQAFEYAVRMRRFPQSGLLDHLLERDALTREHMDSLADTIAAFHQAPLTGGPPPPPMDTVDGLQQPVFENLTQLHDLPTSDGLRPQIVRLAQWTHRQAGHLGPLMQRRLAEGRVRECHGDLHLKNIVCLDGRPVPFDGIEFSEQLRWIDVMSELAFLCMDLEYRGRPDYAARVLSRYLDATGDHGGAPLLRYYQTYRALVRAKIQALHLARNELTQEQRQQIIRERDDYLCLAERFTAPPTPALTITCGLSASGKSSSAMALLEQSGAIRLRSDVERKRLQGLPPNARTGAALDSGIYNAASSRATYQRLAEKAEQLLAAGWPVVVDAACLRRQQRDRFRQLAARLGLPLRILYCEQPVDELRRRIRSRTARGGDPSEADEQVLNAQRKQFQPLEADELTLVIRPENHPLSAFADRQALNPPD